MIGLGYGMAPETTNRHDVYGLGGCVWVEGFGSQMWDRDIPRGQVENIIHACGVHIAVRKI